MNGYMLGTESKFIIYGAGIRGKECYQYLLKMNYDVRFIIDKEPGNVNGDYKCEVVSLDEMPSEELKESVVIICLQNGMLHDEIAENLHKRGANYIIFLPTCKKYEYEGIMRNAYRALLDKELSFGFTIPCYEDMLKMENQTNIISSSENMVTCWVSMEYIFSMTEKNKEGKYLNRHISYANSYLELYSYLDGVDVYPNAYLTIARGMENDKKEQLLKDREKLWYMYEEKNNVEKDYFVEAAPYVVWNGEINRINIVDGHHRAIYMYYKGWYDIPVRMTKDDYCEYMEYRQVQPWNELERKDRIALFKLSVKLSKWLSANNIFVNNVLEANWLKGYIRWRLESEELYVKQGISTEKKVCGIYVLLDDEDIVGFLNDEDSYVYILTNKNKASKYNLNICEKVYSGYLMNRREEIVLCKR